MATNVFIGSIMLVPYDFAPTGFALCQGQLLSIVQNAALFSLLGTYFGGDGVRTFALPDLRGSLAIGMGQGPGLSPYELGEMGGEVTVTLNNSTVPTHNHAIMGTESSANSATPANCALARTSGPVPYSNQSNPLVSMAPSALPPVGSGLPHNNLMPYTVLNWIIALQGIFPSRG